MAGMFGMSWSLAASADSTSFWAEAMREELRPKTAMEDSVREEENGFRWLLDV